MRKSLAPHARERMWRAEEYERASALVARVEQRFRVQWLDSANAATVPAAWLNTQPDHTALLQRPERAERNAASWQRLAILLAVACALLLVLR